VTRFFACDPTTELRCCVQLKKLYCVGNLLKTFPDVFENMTQLEDLNLSANKLTSLPPSLCRLPNLVQLNVSWNSLRYLPDEVKPHMVARVPCFVLFPRTCCYRRRR
jgi:Leucine-rich repeat (LRR) protein